jgi:PAS domain S-box-containing protein
MALPLPGTPAIDLDSHNLPGRVYSFLQKNIIPGVLLVIVIAILYAVSRYNFALFHTAIEVSTIAVAVAIFLLVWKSRHIVQNNYLLFIGVTFVFIAFLDFLHTTVYQGVGIFPDGGGTLSTRLWIAARYLQAVTLLAAPLMIRRKLRIDLVAILYLVADIIIVASIFIFRNFPVTFIEGVGLTPFKILSEYIICAMLAGAVILLYRNRESFDRQVLDNLIIAIVLMIVSELAFTEYASFVDIFSVIGHVVRLFSYYFFYRAIIEVGQEKPYNLLYRDLNESEKKYRALSELSPDVILVHRQGIILYLNLAGLRFFGISDREEITGKNILDYLPPEDRTAGEVRITTVEDQQVIVPLTEVRYVVNGRTIPAEVTAGPTLWEGAPAVQAVIRDITLRKRTEEALRENEERLNLSLEVSQMGTWDLDLVRHTAHRSIRHDQIFGYQVLLPEWTYEIFLSHIVPEDREEVDRKFQYAIENNEDWNFECRVLRKDGILRWILARGKGEYYVSGKPVRMIGIVQDITERRNAEEELRRRNEDLNAANEELTATQEELQGSNDDLIKSEEELRRTTQYLENLINYANAPVIVWDPQFLITRFNHAFENLTGWNAAGIIGQRLEVLFPSQYLESSMEIIRKTMKGERLSVVEIPILNRDGEIRIVLWNSATLFEADGITVLSTIAQGSDITERKSAEEELRRRNEDLIAANEEITATQEELQQNIEELSKREHQLSDALAEKEVLLAEVHHRVKNNLTAFISLLSLEGTYESSPEAQSLKKDLQNRARSMALIHETLYRTRKYSSVDMGLYLETLISQVADSYTYGKHISTIVEAEGVIIDLARATPCGLIVNELVTNSYKYAFPDYFDCLKERKGPCIIRISLTKEDGIYVLKAGDNGIGLPEGIDILTTKSLGLKLVHFLARHQLRAKTEIIRKNGSEFIFRFSETITSSG